MTTRNMRAGWIPLIALAVVAACDQGPSAEVQNQLATAQAQKDSLLEEVSQTARFMSDISAELAKVQIDKQLTIRAESPRQAQRDSILEKIGYITDRVSEGEQRLRDARTRIRALTGSNDSLSAMLESTIDNYEQAIESHKATIASLTEQVEELKFENQQLTVTNVALTDTVSDLRTENNTVYYVVGDKDELLERGIIEKEGGARFLFIFGKRGETLVPARELEPSAFTPINKWEVTEIPLPDSTKKYRIASRQDVQYLTTPLDGDGRLKAESLQIADPEGFWKGSKFLIVVRG